MPDFGVSRILWRAWGRKNGRARKSSVKSFEVQVNPNPSFTMQSGQLVTLLQSESRKVYSFLDPKLPLALFLVALGYYFTHFWGPG